jgi:hypothetical protein
VQHLPRIQKWLIGAVLAAGLGGCGGVDVDLRDFNLAPLPSDFFSGPSWMTNVSNQGSTFDRKVTPTDLISPDGSCVGMSSGPAVVSADAPSPLDPVAPSAATSSGAPVPLGGPAGAPGAAAPVAFSGVGLGMTECDVVKRLGPVVAPRIGTNDRGERAVELTYIQGPRPGTYRFVSGRLISMERVPEPPAATKPQKKRRART